MAPRTALVMPAESELTRLRQLAAALVRPGEEAEDLVQDALLAVLRSDSGADAHPPAFWRRLMLNRRADERRAAISRRHREESVARSEAAGSDESERRALRVLLDSALDRTPEPYASTLRARYFEGLSPGEIAARSGERPGTVKRRLERGLSRLRRTIGPRPRFAWPFGLAAPLRPVLVGVSAVSKSILALLAALTLIVFGLLWWDHEGDDALTETPALVEEGDDLSGSSARRAVQDETPLSDQIPIETPPSSPDEALAFDRDLDLFGTVLGPDGPIEGAHLETFAFPDVRVALLGRGDRLRKHKIEEGVSDAEGRFSLRHARGRLVNLVATKPGFGRVELPLRLAGEQVTITMRPEARLSLQVLDESGAPAAAARVESYRLETERPRGSRFDEQRLVCDEEGRLLISELDAGVLSLRALHPLLGESERVDLTLEAGEEHEAELKLVGGRIVEGRVLDAITDAPIADATIGRDWVQRGAVKSEKDGGFRIGGIPISGAREIWVSAKGYARSAQTPPKRGEMIIRLERGHRLRGRVVDAEGEPLSDVRVNAVHGGGGAVDSLRTKSQKNGAFLLEGLVATLPHMVILQADGYGRHLIEVDSSLADELDVIDLGDVKLTPGLTIEGRVLGHDGEPIPNATVTLRGSNDDRGRYRAGKGELPLYHGGEEARRCDDLGRFRFNDLSAGSYKLSTRLISVNATALELELQADLLDLELRLDNSPPFLVRLVDDEGAPVVGSYVRLRWSEPEDGMVTAESDGEGRCRLGGVPVEVDLKVEVFVVDDAVRQPKLFTTRRSDEELVVELPRRRGIRGRLLQPDGKPFVYGVIEIRGPKGVDHELTGEDGSFLAALAPGQRVDLVFNGRAVIPPGGGEVRSPFRAEALGVVAPQNDLVLRCREIASDHQLRVMVRLPDGSPAAGAQLTSPSFSWSKKHICDAQGRLVLEGLTDEAFLLRARPAEFNSPLIPSAPRWIVADGSSIELRLREALQARVRCVDAEGNAIAGARVMAQAHETPDGVSMTQTLSIMGRSRVSDEEGLAPLPLAQGVLYELEAFLDGEDGRISSGKVEWLASEEVKELVLK